MPTLRLAYATQYSIAVIAVFVLWSQVGGQSHLDLLPWYIKLGLGAGAALAVVRATVAAVSQEQTWNGRTLKWLGILLVLLVGCGLASYYAHLYLEDEGDDQPDNSNAVGAISGAISGTGYITSKYKSAIEAEFRGYVACPRNSPPDFSPPAAD
jgi:hypothetical protein